MATASVQLKRCNRCQQEKPHEDFCKNRARWDGLQHYCKECRQAYERRPDQKAKRLAQVRRYQATEKGKATAKRVDEKRRGSPQVKARARIHDRVYDGRMPSARSLECAHCGNPAHEYHHHLGYEPPNDLAVIPLCRDCHKAAGRQ